MQADRFTVKAQEALAAAQSLARARRNPEVSPAHLLVVLLEQEGGIVVPVIRRAGADPERVRRRANEALDALPTISGDAASAPSLSRGLIEVLNRAERGGARDGRRVRLDRAPSPVARERAAARRRRLARPDRRGGRPGPRPAPRDRSEPRGQVSGAREVRPRPHRGRRAGQARPGHRPRRRGPPRDPGAVKAHEEQPGPDRGAGRGQDRDRRGARPADRVG